MEFTEAEAKEKVGRWVRVLDETWGRVRIPRGALGECVRAQRQQRDEGSKEECGWVVCLEFALAPDNEVSICLRDVDKAQYASTFAELPAELSRENTGLSRTVQPLKPHSSLARGNTLTVVRRLQT